MTFSDFLKSNIVCLDGGMGTLLQERGLLPGEYPERWNVTHPDVITKIHTDYFDAGDDKEQLLITTVLRFPLLFFICSPISASA